jgi:hypothetical protein
MTDHWLDSTLSKFHWLKRAWRLDPEFVHTGAKAMTVALNIWFPSSNGNHFQNFQRAHTSQ